MSISFYLIIYFSTVPTEPDKISHLYCIPFFLTASISSVRTTLMYEQTILSIYLCLLNVKNGRKNNYSLFVFFTKEFLVDLPYKNICQNIIIVKSGLFLCIKIILCYTHWIFLYNKWRECYYWLAMVGY